MPSPKLRLDGIRQIAVTARDVERAVAFYRDVLELPLLFQAPPGLAFFDCGGVRLMLSVPEAGELDHPSSILYFRVADIEQAHQILIGREVRFEEAPRLLARMPDHDLWLASFRDSEGNILALMSEKPRG
ncbi:MAG TPA: VOC family protein [Thermoanaerobaculia bacterium]|nr:VOC family protein [Thermoanaerobaculia bacterium]